MIRRFTIKGFKRFAKETTIDLGDATVLVGANNSGKSTILQALALFQYCVETTRNGQRNGVAPQGRALTKRTVSPNEFGVLPVADPADLWPDGRVIAAGKARPIELRAEFESGAAVAFKLQISYNRFSVAPSISGSLSGSVLSREVRLIPIFSGFLPREEFLTQPARQDRMRLQRHGEMIRNLLWELREGAPARWEKLLQLLAELFPDSKVDVSFDIEVDRFLKAGYRDQILVRERDIIAAGSGFHQILQILASVLAPGAGTVLLDEPDAHLHARLQGQLMAMLVRLAREEGLQFVLATHSPQLLGAAPSGSVRICARGKVVALAADPDQLRLLGDLGAIDRMELVPLLTNRTVVFVENRSDRKLLECFARKYWGVTKQQEVWRSLTFLFTYGSPVDSHVLELARQVRDLLSESGLEQRGGAIRMIAIGDRDYRTDASRRKVITEHGKKAQSKSYGLDFKLFLWGELEVENYLLDADAITRALEQSVAAQPDLASRWEASREAFVEELSRLSRAQKETVRQKIAWSIQQQDRHLTLPTAMERADDFLDREWERPEKWCDAKKVLSGLRRWLADQDLPMRIAESEIVDAMTTIPVDVQKVLRELQSLSRPRPKGRRRSKTTR